MPEPDAEKQLPSEPPEGGGKSQSATAEEWHVTDEETIDSSMECSRSAQGVSGTGSWPARAMGAATPAPW